jgi:hypothetical protein
MIPDSEKTQRSRNECPFGDQRFKGTCESGDQKIKRRRGVE